MKYSPRNLVFATLASFTLASHGATSFTENFSGLNAGPNLTAGAGYGSPTTDFTGSNFTITSGDNNRTYLGTNDTDYSTVNFTFEADVTIPNLSDPWSIAFIGMGSPDADGGFYGEPTTGSNIIMGVRNDEDKLVSRDNGALADVYTSVGLTTTTHGIRMEWDAATKQATFKFDLGNDGTYDPGLTFTVDGSDNGFTAANSRLFIGGGNGLVFDNVVVSVPEPSAALLGALGVLGLMRRRRI